MIAEGIRLFRLADKLIQLNPPTELEVAALVYAVKHFEVYLSGNSFTVYTDHKSLVSAFISHMKSQPKTLLARWYLMITRFLPKIQLECKPGSV